MTPIDILFSIESGDLAVSGGDLVMGESTLQHQYDIIMAGKGDYHHAPNLGVGITDYLNDQTALPLLRASIRAELVKDEMEVEYVGLQPNGEIQVQASYL